MYYMDVKRSLLILVTLSLVLAACNSSSRPPRIDTPAPDFTVKDSDHAVTLSHYKGKPVLLNFWATWCPPCVEEMPSLVQLQQKMEGKITVIAVSVDVDDSAYHHFIKANNVNLLTVRDGEQKSSALYGTFKYPETYAIDSKGIIRRKFIGAVNWNDPDIQAYLNGL
jgi:cytochrome c biogenesis protein CcmG, thiol:disulfide interchange protein DsbE